MACIRHLNKLEQEILINEEADFLDLNVPLSEQMRLIKEEKAFKDPLGNFHKTNLYNHLKMQVCLKKNIWTWLKLVKF